jgi:hypothetical protein
VQGRASCPSTKNDTTDEKKTADQMTQPMKKTQPMKNAANRFEK